MSKSKGNVIEIGMDADTTAKLIKKAVTDSDRLHHLRSGEPSRGVEPGHAGRAVHGARPGGRSPTEVGNGGGGGLKKLVTESVNEFFAPIRAQAGRNWPPIPATSWTILRKGNAHANEVGDATLAEVRAAMNMVY